MPRVLHVIPNFGLGGAERMAVHLMREMDHSQFQIAAVSLYGPQVSDLETMLGQAGIRTWYLGKRKGFDARMYPRLQAIFREFKPQLVHTHLSVLRYVWPLLLPRRQVAVHTVHSLADKEVDRVGRWVHWVAFRGWVVPIAIAESVRESIRQIYHLRDVEIIPNGIPVQIYELPEAARWALRAAEGVNPDVPVIVSVASLTRQKNQALLLEALALEPARRTQAHLWLVGQGDQRAELELRVKELGLDGRVRFLGNRHDIPGLLAAADVFALASSWEGCPLSVMEAMAAGKAIVATAVGGVPELVESGRTGVLVPPGSAQAFAEALVRVVADAHLRESLGRAARREAQRRMDSTEMARRYMELYKQRITIERN